MLVCVFWLYNDGFRLLTPVTWLWRMPFYCEHMHMQTTRDRGYETLTHSLAHKPNTFCFLFLSTLLYHHQGPFFFLFSFLGNAARAITNASRPGLYNLCGIFDQWCFCVRAASENGLSSAVWSQIGYFQQTQNHFFTGDLAAKECSVCTSGPEKFTKADHQVFLWIF